jgi:hypothetical protein
MLTDSLPLRRKRFATLDSLKEYIEANYPSFRSRPAHQPHHQRHPLLLKRSEQPYPYGFTLRDQFGLTGVKRGCERGQCGACTVLIDGAPALACMTLAVECDVAPLSP